MKIASYGCLQGWDAAKRNHLFQNSAQLILDLLMAGLQNNGIILLSCIRKVKKVQQSERLKLDVNA